MSALDEQTFPKAAIFGAAALIGLTILGTAMVRLQKASAPAEVSASESIPVVQTRQLRFVDHGGGISAFGGAVTAYDAQTGALIGDLRPNDGFVRAVLNSLAFERTRRALSGQAVVVLRLRADNRLLIRDTETGAEINLNAFGAANRSVFLRFLPEGGAA